MLDDDDLPVLNAVVRGGDAAIIRAVRLGSGPAVATRVERRIDAIVERHVEALRRDVRDVLERSLGDADA